MGRRAAVRTGRPRRGALAAAGSPRAAGRQPRVAPLGGAGLLALRGLRRGYDRDAPPLALPGRREPFRPRGGRGPLDVDAPRGAPARGESGGPARAHPAARGQPGPARRERDLRVQLRRRAGAPPRGVRRAGRHERRCGDVAPPRAPDDGAGREDFGGLAGGARILRRGVRPPGPRRRRRARRLPQRLRPGPGVGLGAGVRGGEEEVQVLGG
mmetsp:Transcript_39468/g.119256  ORF Transcript_39468/g.119256 Transcript_39468/m.119256 type:complete len:212 (-) Transcript_39468:108-743(-)